MNFRKETLIYRLLIIVIALGGFAGASYAQPTVSISGIPASPTTAPTASFTVTASPSPTPGTSITKVVFYRNDVPLITDTSSPYQLAQNPLGQDTYTYVARAYDSTGAWADSAAVKLEARTPNVYRMGGPNPPGAPSTQGPGTFKDHTANIRTAIAYLKGLPGNPGGTIVFPCPNAPVNESISVYNIRETIDIPSDITLQGESAEFGGPCRVYWNDTTISSGNNPNDMQCHIPVAAETTHQAMFRIPGGTSRVRFRDLMFYARNTGPNCARYGDDDSDEIAENYNTAIEMNTGTEACLVHPETCGLEDPGGDINDLIFENIAITNFRYGISAVSEAAPERQIYDVKIRAYRPIKNHRQLFIDVKYAYDWDVQNLNVTSMLENQGVVEIVNAGKPPAYSGTNGKLKFLQLNCNGNKQRTPAFCVSVQKHGGLYFRQLHHEGVNQALIVEDIDSRGTNPDPIILENSVATGIFKDASMKLYLIGNGVFAAPEIATTEVPNDNGRLRFSGDGLSSTLFDCGDIHVDLTDINTGTGPNQYETKMSYTHSERYRGSFFSLTGGPSPALPHTYCPANINEIGGEYFNNGVMPTMAVADNASQYTRIMDILTCPSLDGDVCLPPLLAQNGSVYIDGTFTFDHTVTIPRGKQITGSGSAVLKFEPGSGRGDKVLFRINLPVPTIPDPFSASGIVLRNLSLLKETFQTGKKAIEMLGEDSSDPNIIGASKDIHFSGLTITGFDTGIDAVPVNSAIQPQIDGMSMKNMTFLNNKTAVKIFSGNASNWNVMNLSMQAGVEGATGWNQKYGGFQGLQGVTCQGTTVTMEDCIRLEIVSGFNLLGLKQTQNVNNAVTVALGGSPYTGIYTAEQFTSINVRNNDFTSSSLDKGRMKVLGKAFITSMNNKYQYFDVQVSNPNTQENQSRLTHCGDTYPGGTVYPGLEEMQLSIWVGTKIPARFKCETRPVPWDDTIKWGGNAGDVPLVGSFYSNDREDFVIYRPGSQSQFLIRQNGGTATQTINWGISGDTPLIGRFFANNTKAQIVAWRAGVWWVWDPDPNHSSNYSIWFLGASGDTPFVGNFTNDGDPLDDIGIFHPGSPNTIQVYNPRTAVLTTRTTNADPASKIQVGNFLGASPAYDQIAQFKDGTWAIFDQTTTPNGTTYTTTFGQTNDIPVAGKYLPGSCTQLGYWRPNTQQLFAQFFAADVPNPIANCGGRSVSLYWGSSNNLDSLHTADDDIPFTMKAEGSTLRRPTAYRPTKGVFDQSLAAGQWWVHDLIPAP